MEATATGLTTGTLGAFTVVHGAAAQIALSGSTTNLDLRRDPGADGDDPGRGRQHGHLRQLHRRRLRQGRPAPAPSPARATRPPRAVSPPRRSPGALAGSVTMEATSAGLTTGTLAAFTVVHGAAADIVLTGSTANLTSGATRVLTATIVRTPPEHGHLRQLHRRRLRQGLRRRHRQRHRQRDRLRRRRHEDDHRRTRRLGDDGSDRDRPHHRHPRRLHRRPRCRCPDRTDRLDGQPRPRAPTAC